MTSRFTISKAFFISECSRIAIERGGRFLSDSYVDSISMMNWHCGACGGGFAASWNQVRNGFWCRCRAPKVKKRLSIDDLKGMAEKHGGTLLSNTYSGIMGRYLWLCAEGHQFYQTGNLVRSKGNWCTVCALNSRREKTRETKRTEIDSLAKEIGFEFLSFVGIGIGKSNFKCVRGHEFTVATSEVENDGLCCKICDPTINKITLSDLSAWASGKGGRCVSTEYRNREYRYAWKCKRGHTFLASAVSVKAGKWCSTCAHMRTSIRSLQRIAREHGGECVSEVYENSDTSLKLANFRCADGHEFSLTASKLRAGKWCKACRELKLKAKDTRAA